MLRGTRGGENGACVYPPRTICHDDEDACTSNDTCSEGVCIGEHGGAETTPDTCAGDMIRRSYIPGTGICDSDTGLCNYQYEDTTCDVGCGMVDPVK